MATIVEDYVSFEVAKLLKEKGFNEPTLAYAYGNDMVAYYSQPRVTDDFKVEAGRYPLPTLQMACKWLREVHSLHIWIGHTAGKVLSWYYEIHGISDGKVKHIGGIQCGSYEVACEAAIKYCLENLI